MRLTPDRVDKIKCTHERMYTNHNHMITAFTMWPFLRLGINNYCFQILPNLDHPLLTQCTLFCDCLCTLVGIQHAILQRVTSIMIFHTLSSCLKLAAVTSGLLTIVKTGITIVSYFANVTASLFALTIVRKFTPRWSKTMQTNYSYTQAGFMG